MEHLTKHEIMNRFHQIHDYVDLEVVKIATVLETIIYYRKLLQDHCSMDIPDQYDELEVLQNLYAVTDDSFVEWELPTYVGVLTMNKRMGRKNPEIDHMQQLKQYSPKMLMRCIQNDLVDCADPAAECLALNALYVTQNSQYGMLQSAT